MKHPVSMILACILFFGGVVMALFPPARYIGACAAAVVKLAVCPLLGAAICAAMGLPPLHRFVVVTYLSCPSAVASFVMADAMGGDAPLAAASVALTTLLSAFSLSAAILLFLP